jgi:hypothetical protein
MFRDKTIRQLIIERITSHTSNFGILTSIEYIKGLRGLSNEELLIEYESRIDEIKTYEEWLNE